MGFVVLCEQSQIVNNTDVLVLKIKIDFIICGLFQLFTNSLKPRSQVQTARTLVHQNPTLNFSWKVFFHVRVSFHFSVD